MEASAKINDATNKAPHICWNVREKTCFKTLPPGRRMVKITSQETRIDVPPLSGLKLNTEVIALCVTEDRAAIDNLNRLIAGRVDHGPVQATTTMMRMM